MKANRVIMSMALALTIYAFDALSSYGFSYKTLLSVNDSVVTGSFNVKNDSTVVAKDTTAVVNKKAKSDEYVLTAGFYVKDFLTHIGVDSIEAELLWARDSSFVDSAKVQSYDNNGRRISAVLASIKKTGDYLIRLRANGYRTLYVPASIPKFHKREKVRVLKDAYMHRLPKEREIDLNEVVVKATKLKFYMDGDTLVYDADAFNLAEGSMLDGLIKRLPGVTLSKDGEITVNGKKVESMLLNGKDFFDSDRNLMLENLPSYMVKNVQVYERTPENVLGSAKAKDAKKELVMNVKLKKEYNGGWIANAEGGIGTPYKDNWEGKREAKFLGRFLALHFNDKSRFSIFANANNLNDWRNPGEGDGEWSPLTQSDGLTTQYKVGMNGMTMLDDEDSKYQGSLTFSYSDISNANHSTGARFISSPEEDANGDYVLDANGQNKMVRSDTYSKSAYSKISYDYRLETRHDIRLQKIGNILGAFKAGYISITPSLDYLKWDNLSNQSSVTLKEDVAAALGKNWLDSIKAPQAGDLLKKYATSRNLNTTKGVGHWLTMSANGYGYLVPTYNDDLNIDMTFRTSYTDQKDYDYQHYFVETPSYSVKQNNYTPTFKKNFNGSVGLELYYRYAKKQSMALNYGINYVMNENNYHLYTLEKLNGWENYDKNPLGMLPSMEELYKSLDEYNSKVSTAKSFSHLPTLRWAYDDYDEETEKRTDLSLTLSLPVTHESLDYWQGMQVDTVLKRNTVLPSCHLYFSKGNYKKGMDLWGNADIYINAPSLSNMLDIKDSRNPQYTYKYNPNLKNTVSYNASGGYRNKFGRTLFNIHLGTTVTRNAVGNCRIVRLGDDHVTSSPMNINGNWNANGGFGVDLPLDKGEKFRMWEHMNYSFNNSVDFSGTDSLSIIRSVVKNHSLGDDMGVRFRPNDKLEFSAKGEVQWQRSMSNRADFNTINAFTFNYGCTAQIELPWSMQFSTDLTMYSRRGYDDADMNTDELVWNARLSKRLMHGRFIIQLDGFDLLGNLSNVQRYVNAQGRTETFYNVIPSYCLLHAIWRFNKQPKKKG